MARRIIYYKVSVDLELPVLITGPLQSCLFCPVACLILNRSASNPMEKGACNSIHYQHYGQNSNIASKYIMQIRKSAHVVKFYILITCKEWKGSDLRGHMEVNWPLPSNEELLLSSDTPSSKCIGYGTSAIPVCPLL